MKSPPLLAGRTVQLYNNISDYAASENLCDDLTVLSDMTLISCASTLHEKIRRFFMFATPVKDETGYSVAACRFVHYKILEPRHEISNNVVCETSKA